MQRKDAEREKARRLRAEGLSVRRIAAQLDVALSSVSVWVRDVAPPPKVVPLPPSSSAANESSDRPRKRCPKCATDLPLTSFNRAGDGHQHWCRECFKAYFRARGDKHRAHVKRNARDRRERSREFILEYLASRSCVDCGESEILVLEFDHHRGEKYMDIARMVADGASDRRLLRELERCEVVCVNCHRRRTALRGAWYRVTGVPAATWTPGQRRNHAHLRELLRRSSCVDCGERDPVVLEFDHVGDKRGDVCKLAGWCSMEVLEREVDACVVRCCNCHRLRTTASSGTYRDVEPWAALE